MFELMDGQRFLKGIGPFFGLNAVKSVDVAFLS